MESELSLKGAFLNINNNKKLFIVYETVSALNTSLLLFF